MPSIRCCICVSICSCSCSYLAKSRANGSATRTRLTMSQNFFIGLRGNPRARRQHDHLSDTELIRILHIGFIGFIEPLPNIFVLVYLFGNGHERVALFHLIGERLRRGAIGFRRGLAEEALEHVIFWILRKGLLPILTGLLDLAHG